jgi:hypothetical protein
MQKLIDWAFLWTLYHQTDCVHICIFLKKSTLLFDERKFSTTNFRFLIIKYKMACLRSKCSLLLAHTDVAIYRFLAMTISPTCCFAAPSAHLMTGSILLARNNVNHEFPLVWSHHWKMINHSISFNNCHLLFTVIWIIIGLSQCLNHNEHEETDENRNKLFWMHGTYMKSMILPL